jgi:type IV secretion system protein VirD4
MNGSKTRRNVHQIVFGGSGAGKSYSLVKPNALQMNCSYVFTDPKGELLEGLAHPLEENGYEIKVFNLSEMNKSLTYNPFAYIRDENGVRLMVKCIIDNTRGTEKVGGDTFWEDSMTALLQAISFYMIEELPMEERNFTTVMKILRLAQVNENNANDESEFDLLFKRLEAKKPNCMAVMSYKTFRIASGKTLKNILVTCMTRLDVFNMSAVASLTGTDTLRLEELGQKRQALFVIIPAADKTFNFLASTLYTQLFETEYFLAENRYPQQYLLQQGCDTYLVCDTKEEIERKYKILKDLQKSPKNAIVLNETTKRYEVIDPGTGECIESFLTEKAATWYLTHAGGKIVRGKRRLPYDVRFLLDEFANTGRIPGFTEKISTMRSYKMWCMIILQNINQLKKMYQEDLGTIIGNCDTFIFLGSQEKEMIEYIETFLGKTQKRQKSNSLNFKKGDGENYQYTSANLLAFDQIRELEDDDCIIFIRGQRPFKAQKFNYKDHPKYGLTGDAKDEYKFIIPWDNRREEDKLRDEQEIAEGKALQYKKHKEKAMSMPFNAAEIFAKLCENKPENLPEKMVVEAEPEPVAETPQEKETAEQSYEESEQSMEQDIDRSGDLWDDLGSDLF